MKIICKNIMVSFVLIACCMVPRSQAQTLQPEQLDHNLRVYRDTVSEQLYWPKDLPVYVWLSTSNEMDAPKHRLEKVTRKNRQEMESLPRSNVNLELTGNQYLRWVNFNTKDTLLFKFQADGIAPESDVSLSGAASFTKDGTRYFGKGLQADFNANDTGAGIENIYTSVNGAHYTPQFGTFDFNQETEYTVSYYAVDQVGNVEEVNNTGFTVDLNPPSVRHQVKGIQQGSILAGSTNIVLISSDELSGLSKVLYYFDDEDSKKTYTEPISISHLSEGSHNLYYQAVDNVENQGEPSMFQFYLDKTTPGTKLIVEGDQYQGEQFYVSNRTRYRLTASDNKTGTRTSFYRIDDQTNQEFDNSRFSLPETEGEHTIVFWSVDNVDNREENQSRTLIMDTSPPVSSHRFLGNSYTQRGITWITESTQVELQSEDSLSGTEQIQYSVANGVQDAVYEQPVEFTNEGKYEIEYSATDWVNNREDANLLTLFVDNTPPEIIPNFSASKIGSSTSEDGSVLDQYPQNTVMYLAATDEASGAQGAWVTINGEEEIKYTGPITFGELGEQNVQLRSVDRVGNEKVQNLRFIISE